MLGEGARDHTMRYEAIDHVILPVASLDAAAPYERLGLRLTAPMRHPGLGTENRCVFAGDAATLFYVELLRLADQDEARRNPLAPLVSALDQPRGLAVVVVRVGDIEAARAHLAARGVTATSVEVFGPDGRKGCDFALLAMQAPAAVSLALVQYVTPQDAAFTVRQDAGLLNHALPLKRLDHLAAVAPDLDKTSRYWTDTLGIPVFGEVLSPTTRIRQFKVGDAIIELLGPATPDSPIHGRPPGLISMVAMEVPDVAAAVAHARAADFTAPDPATGVLPGTRTATIPAAELSGMALQLLEYV